MLLPYPTTEQITHDILLDVAVKILQRGRAGSLSQALDDIQDALEQVDDVEKTAERKAARAVKVAA